MNHKKFMKKLKDREKAAKIEQRALAVRMCPGCGGNLKLKHDADGVLLGRCGPCHGEHTL